jgi:hypothetical protein
MSVATLISEALSLVEEEKGNPSVDAILLALVIEDGFKDLIAAVDGVAEPLADAADELKGLRIATEDMKT